MTVNFNCILWLNFFVGHLGPIWKRETLFWYVPISGSYTSGTWNSYQSLPTEEVKKPRDDPRDGPRDDPKRLHLQQKVAPVSCPLSLTIQKCLSSAIMNLAGNAYNIIIISFAPTITAYFPNITHAYCIQSLQIYHAIFITRTIKAHFWECCVIWLSTICCCFTIVVDWSWKNALFERLRIWGEGELHSTEVEHTLSPSSPWLYSWVFLDSRDQKSKIEPI